MEVILAIMNLFNSLRVQLLPKNKISSKSFDYYSALTVLFFNLGRIKTNQLICDKLNINCDNALRNTLQKMDNDRSYTKQYKRNNKQKKFLASKKKNKTNKTNNKKKEKQTEIPYIPEITQSVQLKKLNVRMLKQLCKSYNIKNVSNLNKKKLIEKIKEHLSNTSKIKDVEIEQLFTIN